MTTKCTVCGKSGNISSVERMRDGIIMKAVHRNKYGRYVTHKWVEYGSLMNLMDDTHDKKRNPIIVTCPKCGDKGKVNQYRQVRTRPDSVAYYIRHETLYGAGTWGIKEKKPKTRRCYIWNEDRVTLLKILGLWIEQDQRETIPQVQQKS